MKLAEYTQILRSKNAGPFCQTVDLVYSDAEKYRAVRDSGVINRETIASLYSVAPAQVDVFYFDAANAIKVSFPRKHCCGCWDDSDCYGAQQHMPLMDLEIAL